MTIMQSKTYIIRHTHTHTYIYIYMIIDSNISQQNKREKSKLAKNWGNEVCVEHGKTL